METKRLKLIPACLERAEEAHQAVVRSQKNSRSLSAVGTSCADIRSDDRRDRESHRKL